jgi:hypothetical protein
VGRLFITPRELDFINDISKELVKDVIGQKIYYFPISEIKSKVHDVYEEAVEKVFDDPVEIECLVKYNPQDVTTGRFGSEENYTIEAYIQSRDLLQKGIEILEGDFFSFGTVFFEVIKAPSSDTIFGQIEHKRFVTITGKQSRKGQFLAKIHGPTDEKYTDDDAVQETFVQQRGFDKNRLGVTADTRDLQTKGALEKPISKPREVSPKGETSETGSTFYGDDE